MFLLIECGCQDLHCITIYYPPCVVPLLHLLRCELVLDTFLAAWASIFVWYEFTRLWVKFISRGSYIRMFDHLFCLCLFSLACGSLNGRWGISIIMNWLGKLCLTTGSSSIFCICVLFNLCFVYTNYIVCLDYSQSWWWFMPSWWSDWTSRRWARFHPSYLLDYFVLFRCFWIDVE